MPEYTQEQAQKFAERTFKLSAKTIYEKLETVRNENKVIRRRWFWELLQNAKDAVNATDKVSIRLTIGVKDEDHFLKFSHNGKPFRLQDAENLIFPYSDKAEEEESDKSGQFGTGFLATHYLSDKIKVSGVLIEDEKPHLFSFFLDRSGKTKTIIAESVNSSWQEFSDNKQLRVDYSYSPTKFDTSFEYFPSQEKIKEIFDEIDQIKETLPYVLLFVDKIDQVEIHDQVHSTSTIFRKDRGSSKVVSENIHAIKISRIDNSSEASCIELVIAEQDGVQIAIEVGKQDEIHFVKKFNRNLPLFYCPFPLIGSDPYKYPVVVNCTDFRPKEERNGIWLADSEDGKNNKNLLAKTIPLYEQLLNYLAKNNYKNLFFLLKSLKAVNCIVDMDSSEFNKTIQEPLRKIAIETPLVDTPTGERLAIKSESSTIYFGKHSDAEKRKDFWQFIKSLHPAQVPAEVDIDGWHKVIWDDCPSYIVEDFTKKIAACKNVGALVQQLAISKQEALEWLNSYVSFVVKEDQALLNATETAILPNQYGFFGTPANLYVDDGTINDELKAIISDIAPIQSDFIDVRRVLLAKEIYFESSREMGIKDVGLQITAIIQGFLKLDDKTNEVKSIFSKLLNWLRDNSEHAKQHFKGIKEDALLYNVMDEDRIKHVTTIIDQDRSGKITLEELSALTREKLDLLNDPAISAKLALAEQLYEDEKEERKQFQFKKQIGDKFEKAFRLIFDNDPSFTIQKVEGEEDFILRRNGTDEEYYVELKSITLGESSVLMTDKQAKKAAHASGNYCLCIIPNHGEEIDTEYIKTHALFDLEIGKKLADKVSILRCLEDDEDGISVKFDEEFLSRYHRHKYKFEIDRSIWGGLNLSAFKQVIAKVEKLEDSPF